jgi:hypothetical protein
MNMYPINIALPRKDASRGRPCGAAPASWKNARRHDQDHGATTVRPDKTAFPMDIIIVPVHINASYAGANERCGVIQTP